jgi:hypothetical protein
VTMLPAVATTPHKAMTRIDAAVGHHTGSAARASPRRSAAPRGGCGGAVLEATSAGTHPS